MFRFRLFTTLLTVSVVAGATISVSLATIPVSVRVDRTSCIVTNSTNVEC